MASRLLNFSVFLHKYRTPLIIASCGGVFAANVFYHVLPDISYRPLYQAWYKGEPATLSGKLEDVFQQVLKDYGISSPKNFSAFASFGFQPVGAGIPWLPAGAHIGIPANFNSTVDDTNGITNRTIFISGKPLKWDSNIGVALKEALVFSPEAQKFAMAREVARLQSGGPILIGAVAPLCLGGVCVYSVVLKQVFSFYSGRLLFRGAVNTLALAIGYVSYLLISDAVSQWTDYSSDRRAARLSHDYAKGGIEFYDKILSRNRTLRSLMGEKGEEMYAPSGNLFPAHLLKMKQAPYTSRREQILNMMKENL